MVFDELLSFFAKSTQSANWSASRLHSRSNQWTSSVVPEPFILEKVEQVLHKAISRVCFAGGQKEGTLAIFSNRFFVRRAAFDLKVGRCAVQFARKRFEPKLAGARRKI